MFSSLSYRQKNIVLIIGFVIFLLIAYSVSISETIHLMNKKVEIENKLRKVSSAPSKIIEIQKELLSLDANLGSIDKAKDFQHILLEKATSYCQNHREINLDQFPKPYINQQKGYQLETYLCILEGSFKDALGFIYNIEQKWKIGKSVSSEFKVETNYRTGAKKLYTTIYIQSIKPN